MRRVPFDGWGFYALREKVNWRNVRDNDGLHCGSSHLVAANKQFEKEKLLFLLQTCLATNGVQLSLLALPQPPF